MLKDRLATLDSVGRTTNCRMPEIFIELDEDTRNQLRAVLIGNTAPIRGLASALQEEGYQISRDAVFHARQVLQGDRLCSCSVALQAGTNE
jgi:hypothetical protein